MQHHIAIRAGRPQGVFVREVQRPNRRAWARRTVVVLLVVLLAGLFAWAKIAVAATTDVVNIPIGAAADDAEELGAISVDPGAMYHGSTDLELVQDIDAPPFGDQAVGLRFLGIAAPQGATITDAYVTFYAVSADSPNTNGGATNLVIAGQAAGNPTTFGSAHRDISGRPRTSAKVNWSPLAWTARTTYPTPSLAAIVQEIVNRADWSPGNAMVFVITGSGSRSASSYEGSISVGNPSQVPVLHLAWASGDQPALFLPLVRDD